MSPTPERYDIGMGLTQSMLLNFLACRYRVHLSLKEGWVPKHSKDSFRFGSLCHDALEFYYKGIRTKKFAPATPTRTLDHINVRIRACVEENIRNAGAREADMEEEGIMAEALMAGYVRHWGAEDFKREWIGVEGEFDTQFEPGTAAAIRRRGKRDAVFVERAGKGGPAVWLLETKTKSQIDEDTLDLTLAFDFQSLFYLVGLQETVAYPVKGCLYNIMRKPQLRRLEANKKRKKAETDGEYYDRMRKDIADRPDHYYKRFEIVFPAAVVAEYTAQLRLQIIDFKAWVAGQLPTYRNPNSCVTKFKCEYLEHCASGGFAGYSRTRKLFPELDNKTKQAGGGEPPVTHGVQDITKPLPVRTASITHPTPVPKLIQETTHARTPHRRPRRKAARASHRT